MRVVVRCSSSPRSGLPGRPSHVSGGRARVRLRSGGGWRASAWAAVRTLRPQHQHDDDDTNGDALPLPFVSGGRRPDLAVPARIHCAFHWIRPSPTPHLDWGPGTVAVRRAVLTCSRDGHGVYDSAAALVTPPAASTGQQRRGAHSLAAGLPAAGLRARGCLAGARLPPLRASPRKAPHGVSAAGKGWPVRASHYRGRVRERLRVVWR